MSGAQRKKLADISNFNREQRNLIFSSKDYAEKLQKLKLLQHELGCKNVLLGVKKMQLEEQEPPCAHHPSKDKGIDMNHKDTKRKRMSRIKASESSVVKPLQVKENANSKREVSGVIDTTVIPEVTCQTGDDTERGVVSQGANQIVDNIVNKKFVLDAAKSNPIKTSVHSERQCVRRKSTRFPVQETEQTETLIEIDDAKETKEIAWLSLRRRSARLRPQETEPCKSFHEVDEVRKTTKRRRVSSRQQSAMFDFQEPEVTKTLNADDAGSLASDGSRSGAVEPSESRRQDTKDTNGKRRVTTRRQSSKGKSKTATDTDGAIKDDIVTVPSTHINIVQESDLLPSTDSQEDHDRESKNKPKAEETGGMMRTSMRRTSRHAAEKVQSYREVSLKVKLRRDC